MDVTQIRELFPGLTGTIYLNTATMAVGNALARAAYERAVERWSAGRFDWLEAEQAGEEARAHFAALVGAAPDEVALVPAVSTAAGIVAANLPPARPGENIVVTADDFSSNYFPWLLLRERGYEIRAVASVDGQITAEAYGARTDGGTRLLAVSAVQSSTGFRADLAALGRVAAQSGAWFFVDACQAAGAVPLDVQHDGIDFLAAASHKFLLGSRGMGYLFVRRTLLDQMHPVLPGWKAGRKPLESFYGPTMDLSPTASRLDTSLDWFAALAEQGAVEIFRRFGADGILARNAGLSTRLHDALEANGLPVPFAPAHRSTIVSIPVKEPEAVMVRLREANVVASVRAGRIRISAHVYNLEEELDRVAGLIAT